MNHNCYEYQKYLKKVSMTIVPKPIFILPIEKLFCANKVTITLLLVNNLNLMRTRQQMKTICNVQADMLLDHNFPGTKWLTFIQN